MDVRIERELLMLRREVSAGGIVYRKLGNNFQIQLIQDR